MRYAGMFRVEKNFAAVFGSAFMIKMEMQLRSEQSVRIMIVPMLFYFPLKIGYTDNKNTLPLNAGSFR